jgi:hypothetical protein
MKATYTVLLDGVVKGRFNTESTARIVMMDVMNDILNRNTVRLVFFGIFTTLFEINGNKHELKLVEVLD